MNYIWLNGNIIPSDDIEIGILEKNSRNRTAYGNLSFYNGNIFKFDAHIERFFDSAKLLFLDIPFSYSDISLACVDLIKISQLQNGYLNLIIFLNKDIPSLIKNSVNIAIFCLPRTKNYVKNISEKKPLSLEISPIIKPTTKSTIQQAKVLSLQTINHKAKETALNNGFDDAIMLDSSGFVTQASFSNLFIVKNRILYTPSTEYCLNGITRQTIIQIAKENNIQIIEKVIKTNEIFEADEAFLTETLDEINVISSIHEFRFKDKQITQVLYSKLYNLTQGY